MTESIIEVASGGHYCRDCLNDIRDPYDREPEMFTNRVLDSGVCGCCGIVIDAGEIVDTVT